jgi:hypothetical protein
VTIDGARTRIVLAFASAADGQIEIRFMSSPKAIAAIRAGLSADPARPCDQGAEQPRVRPRPRFFDPDAVREHLLSSWSIPMLLSEPIAEARENRCLAVIARSMLNAATQAITVGLNAQAVKLLRKAELWLKTAIDERETPPAQYAPDEHEAQNLLTLALCKWLLHGAIDRRMFGRAMNHEVESIKRHGFWWWGAQNSVFTFLPTRRYQEIKKYIERFEEFEYPDPARPVQWSGEMTWLLCSHKVDGEPNRSRLLGLFDDFLRNHLPVCVEAAHCDGQIGFWGFVPIWMLIKQTYFNEGGTPFDAVQRVLDYVEIGSFTHENV